MQQLAPRRQQTTTPRASNLSKPSQLLARRRGDSQHCPSTIESFCSFGSLHCRRYRDHMIRSWHRCRCRHYTHVFCRYLIGSPSHHPRKEMGRTGHWKIWSFCRQTTGGTKPSPPCSFGSRTVSLSSMGWQIRCWLGWNRSSWKMNWQLRAEWDGISHRWMMGQTTCLSSKKTTSGASSTSTARPPAAQQLAVGCSCYFSLLSCAFYWWSAVELSAIWKRRALVSCISKVFYRWYSFTLRLPLSSFYANMLLSFFFHCWTSEGPSPRTFLSSFFPRLCSTKFVSSACQGPHLSLPIL